MYAVQDAKRLFRVVKVDINFPGVRKFGVSCKNMTSIKTFLMQLVVYIANLTIMDF